MGDEQLSDPQVNEAGVSRAQQPETVTTALEDSDAALSTSR